MYGAAPGRSEMSGGARMEEGDAQHNGEKSSRRKQRWIGERCVSPLFGVEELCFWQLLKKIGIGDEIGSLLEHFLLPK